MRHHFDTVLICPDQGSRPLPAANECLAGWKAFGITVAALAAPPGDGAAHGYQVLPDVELAGQTLASFAASPAAAAGTLLVAADRELRGEGLARGFGAAPHLAVADLLVHGEEPRFVRLEGPPEGFEGLEGVVPYDWARAGERRVMLAAASPRALAEAVARGLRILVLPLDLAAEDPCWVRLDGPPRKLAATLATRKLLLVEAGRALVALGPDEGEDELAALARHGGLELLAPCPELLLPPPGPAEEAAWRSEAPPALPPAPIVTPAVFLADVQRYAGDRALDGAGAITSRHIRHPDNERVVRALLGDLRAMGYAAYTWPFSHAGRTLANVVADLPGRGTLLIEPARLKAIRELLRRHPSPTPPGPWLGPLTELLGEQWLREQRLAGLEPAALRRELDTIFQLRPWLPLDLGGYPLPGPGARLVLVGAHLDSTAAYAPGYNPAADPAPGADDNASGMAAVLATARWLARHRGTLRHTVRMVFFNAEEAGLVGSKAYAAFLKGAGAPLLAAVCPDMIGWNSDAAPIFELHAGWGDPAVRDRSVPVAQRIAARAAAGGKLAPAQIYRGTNGGGGSDRDVYDPALGRSDHAAFHQQGYAAVAVSEDFFVNLPGEPPADPDPYYHRPLDRAVNAAFGAEIAAAVALAVYDMAR